MANNVADRVLDLGLNVLDTEATHVFLCNAEPSTYTAASSTFKLGTKNWGAGNVFGSPAAGSPNGRKVASAAVPDGVVDANGTASHVAVCDVTNTRLLAVIALSATQAVTTPNPWTLPTYDIRLPSQ